MSKICLVYPEAYPWNMALGWVENIRDSGLNVALVAASSTDPEGSLSKVESIKSDVYFFLCGDQHLTFLFDTEDKRRRLKSLCASLICYANESFLNTPWRDLALPKAVLAVETFDHFFSQDETELTFLGSRGATAHFMPQFADQQRYVIRQPWDRRSPQAFSFGQTTTFGVSDDLYRDRRRLVEELRDMPEFAFVSEYIDTTAAPDRLVQLYNASRIAVCLPTNVGGITNRFYEAALCGSTILHYEIQGQPLSNDILRPGTHCLTYDRADPSDLRDKIRWLVDHPDEARRLAERAHRFVVDRHTIARRLDEIMAFAGALMEQAGSRRLDPKS